MRKKRFLSFILAFSLLFGNLTIPNYTTKKAAASDSTTNYEGQSTNPHNQEQDPNWNEVAKNTMSILELKQRMGTNGTTETSE